jgi:hypothetical protein
MPGKSSESPIIFDDLEGLMKLVSSNLFLLMEELKKELLAQ